MKDQEVKMKVSYSVSSRNDMEVDKKYTPRVVI